MIRGTGLVERVEAGIVDGGLEVAGIFDDVPQDSSTEVCDRCAAAAKEAGADSFLALGGGSVMDTAKVADAVFTHGGDAREQEGFFLMPREDDGMGRPLDIAPLACIPTTAGTGSEVSMAAVIKEPDEKVKIEIADFPLFPRLAILDPDTTRTLPPAVAAATGMDAMTHAIEGYVSVDWSPHQDARSLQALRMIRDNLERAVQRGEEDEEARGNMLIAANLAITIALGSVHAMSHPAGAQFGVPHGVANAIHLPHVIRHNAAGDPDIADRYRDIGEIFDVTRPRDRRRARGLRHRAHRPARAAHAPLAGGRAGGRDPGAGGGRDGRRHDAAEPARDVRGGLRGAVPQGPLSVGHLLEGRARGVLRPPAQQLLRPVGLHQHGLPHRVDPGHLLRHERQPRGDLGRGVHERLRNRHRVPAERVGHVGHRERARAREVVGAGLADPAHTGGEGARHVVLVHELEADARVRDHGLQHRQRAEQARARRRASPR